MVSVKRSQLEDYEAYDSKQRVTAAGVVVIQTDAATRDQYKESQTSAGFPSMPTSSGGAQ